MSIPVVTIDGPGGAGKGTVCMALSEKLGGWHILDSGALYRAVALAALDKDLSKVADLVRLAQDCRIEFVKKNNELLVFLEKQDITNQLRSEDCGKKASEIAVIPELRQVLLGVQRAYRQPPGLLADGRDMGSVVFPEANLKVFLTASVEERAERRHKQLKEKGKDVSIRDLLRDIAERDRRDSQRTAAPMRVAKGAVTIDSTGKSITQVVEEIAALIQL